MKINIAINAYLTVKVGVKAVFGRYKAKTTLHAHGEYSLPSSNMRKPGKSWSTNAI